MTRPIILILVFLTSVITSFASTRHNIYYGSNDSIKNKEAILILPGLGDSKKNRKNQMEAFINEGYDVFIPDYIDRKSFDTCVANVVRFVETYELRKYKKLHCFTYILGSFTLNEYIHKYGFGNINTIVYDRSAIQERAPVVVTKKLGPVGWILKGRILWDFRERTYDSIANPDSVQIGIIAENKATKLMRMYKGYTLKMGPLHYNIDSLHQPFDDAAYTVLDHDEMYFRFDIIKAEIFSFIRTGHFPKASQRIPYTFDPFEKQEP